MPSGFHISDRSSLGMLMRGRTKMLLMLGISLVAGAVFAADVSPVESGSDALERAGDLPWYDAEADQLRPVNVRAPAEPPARPDVASQKQRQPSSSSNSGQGIQLAPGAITFWTMLQWAGIGLIGALILFLLVLAIRALAGSSNGPGWELPDDARRVVSDVDRMDQLPIPLKRNLSDLLGEARRHYQEGNYNEAVVYLYSYLLVELDKAQRIRLLRGKTNRQYLRELGDAPPTLSDLVERTMVAFEDVFFGDHTLERARFEACYQQLDEFQQYVEPAAV